MASTFRSLGLALSLFMIALPVSAASISVGSKVNYGGNSVLISSDKRSIQSKADVQISGQVSRQSQFLKKAIPLATAIQKKYNIPAAGLLAMTIIESRYGQSELSIQHCNYFGIKAFGDWKGKRAYVTTTDYVERRRRLVPVRQVQAFRKYNSLEESFEDYALFLTSKKRYARSFTAKTGKDFVCKVLACGYCPTPEYGSMAASIINRYDLAKYDHVN